MSGLSPKFKPSAQARKEFQAILARQQAAISPRNAEGMAKIMRDSGARFVRNVADITPPARGKADIAAKKRGESAIVADLLKLAVVTEVANQTNSSSRAGIQRNEKGHFVKGSGKVSRSTTGQLLSDASALIELHSRSFAKGGVNPRNRKGKIYVQQSTFDKVAKQLMARVGWLAAGLNVAAEKLGRPLPAWIRRHGSKFGKIQVTVSTSGIRITVTQNVPYADGVGGYQRRWAFALSKELRTLKQQAGIVFKKLAERAARSGRK